MLQKQFWELDCSSVFSLEIKNTHYLYKMFSKLLSQLDP